jgi:hypothetical protein
VAVAIQSGSNYTVGPDGRGRMNLITPMGDKTFKLSFILSPVNSPANKTFSLPVSPN